MFKKPYKPPEVPMTRGWTPELVRALMEYASGCPHNGVHFTSKDYDILVDGFILEANNFQTERKAYGRLPLTVSVGEDAVEIHVPVVTYFVLEGDEEYSYFQARIQHPEIEMVRPKEQVKVYGRAILEGRYIPRFGKEHLIPGWSQGSSATPMMVRPEVLHGKVHEIDAVGAGGVESAFVMGLELPADCAGAGSFALDVVS